jgi:hypothetical protein
MRETERRSLFSFDYWSKSDSNIGGGGDLDDVVIASNISASVSDDGDPFTLSGKRLEEFFKAKEPGLTDELRPHFQIVSLVPVKNDFLRYTG